MNQRTQTIIMVAGGILFVVGYLAYAVRKYATVAGG